MTSKTTWCGRGSHDRLDGDGNRVAETVGGVTTKYLVDTQNPIGYAHVVDELRSGAVVRTYSQGLALISKLETGNSTRSFYGFDGHRLGSHPDQLHGRGDRQLR